MRFLLDENAEYRLAAFLRERDHDVTAIARDYPAGLTDDRVLSLAQAEQRVLITNDRDFGDLIFRQRMPHRGVIFFRLADQAIATKIGWLERLLREHVDQLGKFVVVTERGVRIRDSAQ